MKKWFVLWVISAFVVSANAQVEPIKAFYNKYKNYENATQLKLQGWLIRLAAKHTDEEGAEQLLKKITHLRLLSIEDGNPVSLEESRDLIKQLKKESYEELLNVRDGTERVDILIREKKDVITEILLLVSDKDEFLLLSLEGRLKFSDLNDLDIEVDGSEHFKNLPEDRNLVPKA